MIAAIVPSTDAQAAAIACGADLDQPQRGRASKTPAAT